MKSVPCSGPGPCRRGRKHTVEVPDDFNGPAYCSIECACYAGAMSVRLRQDEKTADDRLGRTIVAVETVMQNNVSAEGGPSTCL